LHVPSSEKVYKEDGLTNHPGSENGAGGGALSLSILSVKAICSEIMNKKYFERDEKINILWVNYFALFSLLIIVLTIQIIIIIGWLRIL
jgi:predicted nucleic acid-binding Zn ribbon protein